VCVCVCVCVRARVRVRVLQGSALGTRKEPPSRARPPVIGKVFGLTSFFEFDRNREVLLRRSRGAEVEGTNRHGDPLVASILSSLVLLYTTD
jgi:hypothetical protein